MRNPVRVNDNKSDKQIDSFNDWFKRRILLSDAFQKLISIKCWEASSASCEIHSTHIVHWTE